MDLFGLVFCLVFLGIPLGSIILTWLAFAFSGKAPKGILYVGNGLLLAFLLAIVALCSHTAAVESNQKALYNAAVAGDSARVERLIQSGADVNYWGGETPETPQTPLKGAIYRGQTDTVKTLLRLHADPNLGIPSPLQCAKENDHPDIVRLLKTAGAKERGW